MSPQKPLRAGVRALVTSLLLTAIFALGTATGIYLYPRVAADAGAHPADHDDEQESDSPALGQPRIDNHEDEGDHVALTRQAFENLQLQMGRVSNQDYWKTLLVPARVVEIPGRSDLSVSAPVTGTIANVNVLPGQSLTGGAALFSIRLTDQALVDAQSKLLETLTRQEVANQEIARLSPLTDSGAVSGTKTRDLRYELRQLKAQQSTLTQELLSRGLPQAAIEKLTRDRQLATTLSMDPPSFAMDNQFATRSSFGYSVENLLVHPGQSVTRGDPLCSVAYHSTLYLEGTAFQDDLEVLDRIAENAWKIEVGQHGHSETLKLELLRVDNHVDEETQTVRFYLELPNQVVRSRESDGRRFEQWRFRPGQRLHLRLPVERWENQLVLPADAVVIEGANVLVFAEHLQKEETLASVINDDDAPSSAGIQVTVEEHENVYIELEPVPVRLLHRDDKTVVIADDGQIHRERNIALNNAYKLFLAMKIQAGGGGGHHHDHDH